MTSGLCLRVALSKLQPTPRRLCRTATSFSPSENVASILQIINGGDKPKQRCSKAKEVAVRLDGSKGRFRTRSF